jgi:hypothetical protein
MTMNRPGKKAPGAQKAPAARVPFPRASYRHFEGAFYDASTAIGAGAVSIGPIDIPAFGYARGIFLLVEGSGGVIGAGALSEDYPFVIFDEVTILDVNGAPIYGPLTGYDTYIVNKDGGYNWASDPTGDSFYVATINGVFALWIPLEITQYDGYGALGNMNSAASYKLRLTLAASATAYPTAPTTPATFRVRAFLDAWQRPAEVDAFSGAPNQQEPSGHGTIQFWSAATNAIGGSGDQTFRHTRVGNLIRQWIYILRTSAVPPLRTSTNFPDPITINWDARQLIVEPRRHRDWIYRRDYGLALDTGVFVYPFHDDADGHPGSENRNLWLPTVQATRLEVKGTWGAAGTLRILTNDIAPVGARR